jgi:hypothetical protein
MLTSFVWHSIKTLIKTSHTRVDFLLKLGKVIAEVGEETIRNTVEQTRVSLYEPTRKKAR